jgi:hypothetical protein
MYTIDYLEDGRRKLSEVFRRPMVYLDHWALNDLALSDAYRQRFTDILNNRGGMLRISVYSIRELILSCDLNGTNNPVKASQARHPASIAF